MIGCKGGLYRLWVIGPFWIAFKFDIAVLRVIWCGLKVMGESLERDNFLDPFSKKVTEMAFCLGVIGSNPRKFTASFFI